ncbi:TetR/AcrR family transcriptional regulator [Microbacterium phyllosphaerae]
MAIRSEQSHQAILDATMRMLDADHPDSLTVQKLSIERIAREAGVSKTTIYRWWPSKAAVVIDTFLENHIARTPIREDIPALDALRVHIESLAQVYSGHEGRLIAQLVAECQYDSTTMEVFKDRFWRSRAAATQALIERAVAEGALRSDIDPEVIAELLYSPLYFRLLFAVGPLDEETLRQLMTGALDGVALPV